MAVYSVSWRLRGWFRDGRKIQKELEGFDGALKVTESHWLVAAGDNMRAVGEAIRPHVGPRDLAIVIPIRSRFDWGLIVGIALDDTVYDAWLTDHLGDYRE